MGRTAELVEVKKAEKAIKTGIVEILPFFVGAYVIRPYD